MAVPPFSCSGFYDPSNAAAIMPSSHAAICKAPKVICHLEKRRRPALLTERLRFSKLNFGCEKKHQSRTTPPSRLMASPLIFRAPSDARNNASAAMSAGFWKRFIGMEDSMRRRTVLRSSPVSAQMPSMTRWIIGVSTEPGQIAFTVISLGPSSAARPRVIPITPALEAQ